MTRKRHMYLEVCMCVCACMHIMCMCRCIMQMYTYMAVCVCVCRNAISWFLCTQRSSRTGGLFLPGAILRQTHQHHLYRPLSKRPT